MNVKRQRYPYPSNCTSSWEHTNYTKLVKDFEEHKVKQNDTLLTSEDGQTAIHYNLAVNYLF